MKMTTEQHTLWQNLVKRSQPFYNDIIYVLDCIELVEGYWEYYFKHGVLWLDDTFPEFKDDTRRFVRVWLGDEPIEVED